MTPLDAGLSRPLEGGPSFPLRNRLFRIVWQLAWLLLARWTPPPWHRWRVLVLRAFGAKVARGVRVHGSARIWHPRNLQLDQHALVGPGAQIYNQGHITIGAKAVISQRAHLCASSHDIHDKHFQLELRPVVVGCSCWVAAEAFVGPGVTMHEGSVLAARGVLFTDAAAFGVYRGNPAVLIKKRRSAEG